MTKKIVPKKNCQLYDWNTANHVCPVGWHLPNKEEFKLLLKSVGEISDHGDSVVSKMGYANLRSKGFIIPGKTIVTMLGLLSWYEPFVLWSSEEDDSFVWVLISGTGIEGTDTQEDYAYLKTHSRRGKNPVHCVKD